MAKQKTRGGWRLGTWRLGSPEYVAGQDARLVGKGKKLSQCPYVAGSPAARAWQAGWRAADEWINVDQW